MESKVEKALSAMKALGVRSKVVKPVLKDLLELYENNWVHIEEDNYQVLVEAIFDRKESEQVGISKSGVVKSSSVPPPKRMRLKEKDDKILSTVHNSSSSNTNTSLEVNIDSPGQDNHVRVEKLILGQGIFKMKPNTRKMNSNGSSCVATSSGYEENKSVRANENKAVRADEKKSVRKISDITKGSEQVKISLVDETCSAHNPVFFYIRQNTVYQNAYLAFSIARVGDEDCCPNCLGDCLSLQIPCACARETGGEFAYTQQGLLREEFINECISLNQKPQKDKFFYCKNCPLERSCNNKVIEPCKGHLMRKFIKECWSKCGCSMHCGNRVVQRGIICNLQVFFTKGGKGWGIRTLEDLPKGKFVCEYIGEILTNTELYERNKRRSQARHTYPVLLDADWGSEEFLKDEDALCLDATEYGNVGRFVNHRCVDANLIEVPVSIETPDHHYYHIAFFTTRSIFALEELTWDYGIDFDDYNHPIKAFRCTCGSIYCRDKKRSVEMESMEEQHEELKKHGRKSGGGKDSVCESYHCMFCERGFATTQALGGHLRIHKKQT